MRREPLSYQQISYRLVAAAHDLGLLYSRLPPDELGELRADLSAAITTLRRYADAMGEQAEDYTQPDLPYII